MWEISVSKLTLVAFLPPELLSAHAAAGVQVTLLRHRPQCITATRLAARADVVTPVVGRTFVTSLSYGVGRTDTLARAGVAVISHMGTLARCASSLLEAEVSSGTAVTLLSRDTGLAAALPALITVKRFGAKRVAVARDTAESALQMRASPCPGAVGSSRTASPALPALDVLYGHLLDGPAGLSAAVGRAHELTTAAHEPCPTHTPALRITALGYRATNIALTWPTALRFTVPPTIGHTLVTLPSNHVLATLALSCLLMAEL